MKQFHRRLLALLLPLALLLSTAAYAAGENGNETSGLYRSEEETSRPILTRVREYAYQFNDVPPDSWYYAYVVSGYESGLFEGRGDGFAPDGMIKVSELLTLSARLHAAYAGEDAPAPAAGAEWYMPYVEYLDARGLLDRTINAYDVSATRAQLAAIFALSLPEDCFGGINDELVTDAYAAGKYITDVDEHTPYQAQILWMYRQGLLAGMDDSGSFWPERTTTRAETSALVMRMAEPELRLTLAWELLPDWSASKMTLASLIDGPARLRTTAPDFDDKDAIDELVRDMLASNRNTIELCYSGPITQSGAQTLANVFMDCTKSYCEQMYNSVECQHYLNSGDTILIFSATACKGEQLARYRSETMQKAIEVHDMLWSQGLLTKDMSQTEIARVYFEWLCKNCEYDDNAANNDYSVSHLAYNALVNGKAVCDGYTGAYNLFLKMEGIDCYALPNRTHIWTVALLDNVECHLDVTWGDQVDYVDWSYFAMTPERSMQEHSMRDR